MQNHRLFSYFLLIVTAIIWGVAGSVIKFTLEGIPTIPFLTYRFLISSLISIPFILIYKKTIFNRKYFFGILLFGLLSTISLLLLFFGLENTTVLDMTFITLTGPLMIALAGARVFKDRITQKEKLGMAIVLVGSIITIIQPIFENGFAKLHITGNILVLGYLLLNTVAVIYAKKALRNNVNPFALTSIMFVVGLLLMLPIFFVTQNQNFLGLVNDLPVKYHLGVWFMAMVSGNLAYFTYIRGQKSIEVSEASLFSYLNPVFSAPLAILWLGEKFTPIFLLGAVFIIFGIIVAEYKKPSSSRSN